jgi:glycosyltransferase involved in cell wall biosynthesis
MKLAYVVPRYGSEVHGGAESAVRMLAERLVAHCGYEVEVFTTGALDALTWRDELPAGTAIIEGVTVRRIASAAGRAADFHPVSATLLADPEHTSAEDSRKWVELQGPASPALLEAVSASDADVIAFSPYLYYPTVHGLPLVRQRAIMHPAAHEEPALHLPIFDELFQQCRGFAFYTRSERRMVADRFGVGATPQVLVGLGVDEHDGDEQSARLECGLSDAPYLLCIGRVDDKKGTGILWRYFRTYKERHPGSLQLVLVGQVVDPPDPSPDVTVSGFVSEATKWGLLRGARALVSPSPFESFSLTVIEAMTAGTPVLVNAVCGARREHCEYSGAGLWFEGYGEFEAALDRLLTDSAVHQAMGSRGTRYVEANYRWPVILSRYCAFVEEFAERAS